MKKILRVVGIAFLFLIFACALYWGISMLKCEYLTQRYAEEYVDVVLGDIEPERLHTIKVLDYNDEYVRIYYVLDHFETRRPGYGFVAEISNDKRINSNHMEYCVWSKYGSASSVVWPYWWHFIYGGL